jgi:alcohol dehydrogenase
VNADWNFNRRQVMKALVYQGPGHKALEERPLPELVAPTDAIVRLAKTTICGTDLHILKGDLRRGADPGP